MILGMIDIMKMWEWLGERIQGIVEWAVEQIKAFFGWIVDAIGGIWAALWGWIAHKGDLMVTWLVHTLPPGNPFVDALIDQGESIWEFFFKFIHPAGYFIHFPTLSIMLVIIFSVEGPLFIVQVYLFIKRLIPVA